MLTEIEHDASEASEETSEWLRKPAAAARLGISERTLDKRLASGLLKKRQTLPNGPIEVQLPRLELEVRAEAAGVLLAQYHQDVTTTLAQLQLYVDRIAEQAELIGQLRAQLAAAQAALDAPRHHAWLRFWR